jgi:hypothetical protein
MMVQALMTNQVNGITVIEVPAKDGTYHGMTILIDNGFMGFAIMSHPFAEMLSYKFKHSSGESYRTMAGCMNTTIHSK